MDLIGTRADAVGCVLGFICWQIVHPLMDSLSMTVMPGHQYSCFSKASVLKNPGCPDIGDSWYSQIRFQRRLVLSGTKHRFLYVRRLSSICQSESADWSGGGVLFLWHS